MKLNLGASDRHIDGYTCIDIAPQSCAACGAVEARKVDLSEQWSWSDSMVEDILAYDVCEHIPDAIREYHVKNTALGPLMNRRWTSGRIHFMNELYRVLIPGGRATIETPNAAKGVGFFQDPTHVSPYCFSTFKYFEHGAFARERLGDAYGITARFKVLALTEHPSNGEDPREQVYKIRAVLEAVK